MGKNVLIIEDDLLLGAAMSEVLTAEGYHCFLVSSAREARDTEGEFVCVLLDIGLPGESGINLLSSGLFSCPVCMVTAEADLTVKLEAFGRGADDYLVKPFHMEELVARLRVLSRVERHTRRIIQLGNLTIYRGAPLVRGGSASQQLTPREHQLLLYLADRPGVVVSRGELLEEVWGTVDRYPNTVDVHIETLRKKLRRVGGEQYVHTAYRSGYYVELSS